MKENRPFINKILFLFLLLLQVGVLSSCFVQKNITIQVLMPPDTVMFDTKHDLLLINTMLDEIHRKDTLKFDYLRFPAGLYNQLTWRAIYGFADIAAESPLVNNVLFDSVPGIPGVRNYLNKLQIRRSQEQKVPVSILLRSLTFGDSLVRLRNVIPSDGGDGLLYLGVNLYLPVKALWDVYLSGKGIYPVITQDTIILQGIGVSYYEAVANLPDIRDNLNDLVYQTGNHAAYKLYPVWEDVNRVYYIHLTNKKMVNAELLAESNKWLDAATVWKELAESKKKALAARATFNMAVVAEITDHLDVAEAWLKKSYALKPRKITLKYLNIIRQRQKDRMKIIPSYGSGR